MKVYHLLFFVIPLCGCGSLFKGPRSSYSFSLTVANRSDYILTARVSYDDRSVEDECSKSGDSNSAEVSPGETKGVSISTLCHLEPSSSVSVSFPADASLAQRFYSFAANSKVACSNSDCQIE